MKYKNTGASLVVQTLMSHNVEYVFTVPGAKIDKILDEFNNYENAPKLIVTRHEQNAAFMAQGIGRITGKPGVVLVTSGPGVGNLATGLVTATSESDPVLAIAGNVKRKDSLKRTHQSMNNIAIMESVSKSSKEVLSADAVSEAISNAYRTAISGRKGATFVSIPQDISEEVTEKNALTPIPYGRMGHADKDKISKLAEAIINAKFPILLLGMRSSDSQTTEAIRALLEKIKIPVVETFQGAGVISRELEYLFFGRVGLFKNQPGDMLLDHADLVISIGYDPIEYDPEIWNKDLDKRIYHIDEAYTEIDNFYRPHAELIGDTARTLVKLIQTLPEGIIDTTVENAVILDKIKDKVINQNKKYIAKSNMIHPIQFILALQNMIGDENYKTIDDSTIITVDVGSIYIWMARYFKSFQSRKLLFSNGMQTLGVALPWAIAATLVNDNKKVISMSGDGGFLFSAAELDTAIRLNSNITHIIWNDNSYNMVEFQQELKYDRATAVTLGQIDFVKYAESFGAKGFKISKPEELEQILKIALDYNGVSVVEVTIDYSSNIKLGESLLEELS